MVKISDWTPESGAKPSVKRYANYGRQVIIGFLGMVVELKVQAIPMSVAAGKL